MKSLKKHSAFSLRVANEICWLDLAVDQLAKMLCKFQVEFVCGKAQSKPTSFSENPENYC